MLKYIIKKEIKESLISPRFVITFILCAILIIMAGLSGIINYNNDQKEYEYAFSLHRRNLESQPNFQSLAAIGLKIMRKPEKLGIIINGINESAGRVSTVNFAYDPKLIDSKYDSKPLSSFFGALDMEFIVKIVLSLFAILFTFDTIVGERENGTLKLALSNSVPRDKLILGKLIGTFLVFISAIIIPMIITIIILVISPGISFNSEEWIRALLIFLSFTFYISVFFSLGIFISCLTKNSSSSLLFLLFIWVMVVMIIPKSSIIIAENIRPIPSIYQITAEKEAYLQEIQGQAPVLMAEWKKENHHLLGQGTDVYRSALLKYAEKLQNDLTTKIDKKNSKIEQEYQIKLHSQEQLACNISRISPVSCLMLSSRSLANTGIEEYRRFLNSIKDYKPIFTKWANSKMLNEETMGKLSPADFITMPQFTYKSDNLKVIFIRILPDLIIQLLYVIIFFIGAYVSFLRYEI